MPRPSPIKRRQNAVLRKRVATTPKEFTWLCGRRVTRGLPGIVCEGDSWFAYPGKLANLIDHLVKAVNRKANILRLAANGDEAVEMLAGSQKHRLAEVLKKNSQHIKFLLFSGGGNDVVGKWDMERLLVKYAGSATAAQCINTERLARKLNQIELAYEELIELRDEYASNVVIITHTYDAVVPSDVGARFFWGKVQLVKPWVKPYMDQKGIPGNLQVAVCDLLLGPLEDRLLAITTRPKPPKRFVVVRTQGILTPGLKADWRNEIHPTSSGFKKIFAPIYAEMRKLDRSLPAY